MKIDKRVLDIQRLQEYYGLCERLEKDSECNQSEKQFYKKMKVIVLAEIRNKAENLKTSTH